MKYRSILVLAVAFVFSATLTAQFVRPKMPPGNGGGSSSKDKDKPEAKKKIADLSAADLSAKWKDAKTLEITGTIKNASTFAYSGVRTVKLTCTFKDGKSETLKEQTIPDMAASGSSNFKVELVDKKYFDKDVKWTLELSAGDASAPNDKKGPVTLSPGAQPKG